MLSAPPSYWTVTLLTYLLTGRQSAAVHDISTSIDQGSFYPAGRGWLAHNFTNVCQCHNVIQRSAGHSIKHFCGQYLCKNAAPGQRGFGCVPARGIGGHVMKILTVHLVYF